MLSVSPNYNLYNKYSPICFKAYQGQTTVMNEKGCKVTVNNKTAFFRNYPTLDFTAEYLAKNFPQGTEIAEYGCSLGYKTYGLAMKMDEFNRDKKFRITGYDFKEVLDKKNSKMYTISPYSEYDELLFGNYKSTKDLSKEEAQEITKTFNKYFSPYNPENIKTPKEKEYYSNCKMSGIKIFSPNEDLTDGLVSFKTGNILDIDKTLNPKKTGAVIFQNALYNLYNRSCIVGDIDTVSLEKIFNLFKKINKVLPQNGIFVLGNLPADHLYDCDEDNFFTLKYQNNKCIKVFEDSKIHNMLYACGFEPVFYEGAPSGTPICEGEYFYLPSVWKKTREVKL